MKLKKSMLLWESREVFEMRRRMLLALFCSLLIVSMLPLSASADMGPKPSVTVTVEGVEADTVYYATLLSSEPSNGPLSAYNESETTPYDEDPVQYEVLQKFAQYRDGDGYYFLPQFWVCQGEDTFVWGYYPPDPFKVLLYFPVEERFVVSLSYTAYAFDSYYTIRLEYGSLPAEGLPIAAEESYDHSGEALNFTVRLLLTIALEMVVALIFGLRERKQLLFIGVVNVLTQVLLNLALNLSAYYNGEWAATGTYVLLEVCVCVGEALLYVFLLPRFSQKRAGVGRAVGYAVVANAASFAVGLGLAHLIPGVF